MDAIKLTPKIVREKYFEVIGLLNKAFPGSIVCGKFADCDNRATWISFTYFGKILRVNISFWCRELQEFGNSATGQHCNVTIKEAYDYLKGIEFKLLAKLEKKQEINSLFD